MARRRVRKEPTIFFLGKNSFLLVNVERVSNYVRMYGWTVCTATLVDLKRERRQAKRENDGNDQKRHVVKRTNEKIIIEE